MNSPVARYERAVKQKLTCTNRVRKRLLNHFHVMRDSFLEENASPTEADLHDAFGPPKAMAAELSAMISPEENNRYQKIRLLLRIVTAVLFVLLLLATIYVFFEKQHPIIVVDDYFPSP